MSFCLLDLRLPSLKHTLSVDYLFLLMLSSGFYFPSDVILMFLHAFMFFLCPFHVKYFEHIINFL